MCLVLLAYKIHRDYPLIIASNRDEYYERRSIPAEFWHEYPDLLAGRDIRGEGTWLGLTKNGKIGLLTNYRDPKIYKDFAPSRGKIILSYLTGNNDLKSFLDVLDQSRSVYNPFNLIAGRFDSLYYYSNVNGIIEELKPGVHGLCNHFLNTPWPKVIKTKQGLKRIIEGNEVIKVDNLLELMEDTAQANVDNLPDTGIGMHFEKILSSIFIKTDVYGTKSTTVIFIHQNKEINFYEKSFIDRHDPGTISNFKFKLNINKTVT